MRAAVVVRSERRALPIRAAFVALALLATLGCRTTTTVTYLPTVERPRLTLAEGGATLQQFLQLDCPAAGNDSPSSRDSVVARVVVDEDGTVSQSELEGSSGSSTVDDIIGAITAQLTFSGDGTRPQAGPALVMARYSCVPEVSADLSVLGS